MLENDIITVNTMEEDYEYLNDRFLGLKNYCLEALKVLETEDNKKMLEVIRERVKEY